MIIWYYMILYELGMGCRLGDDVLLYQFTSRDGCSRMCAGVAMAHKRLENMAQK